MGRDLNVIERFLSASAEFKSHGLQGTIAKVGSRCRRTVVREISAELYFGLMNSCAAEFGPFPSPLYMHAFRYIFIPGPKRNR